PALRAPAPARPRAARGAPDAPPRALEARLRGLPLHEVPGGPSPAAAGVRQVRRGGPDARRALRRHVVRRGHLYPRSPAILAPAARGGRVRRLRGWRTLLVRAHGCRPQAGGDRRPARDDVPPAVHRPGRAQLLLEGASGALRRVPGVAVPPGWWVHSSTQRTTRPRKHPLSTAEGGGSSPGARRAPRGPQA